jgi:hypothetical protein
MLSVTIQPIMLGVIMLSVVRLSLLAPHNNKWHDFLRIFSVHVVHMLVAALAQW